MPLEAPKDACIVFSNHVKISVCAHLGKNAAHRQQLQNGKNNNSPPTSAMLCGKLDACIKQDVP